MKAKKNECLGQAIGVDISKDKFDVCCIQINDVKHLTIKATTSFTYTEKGIKEFVLWAKKHSIATIPLTIIMEATGVYYEKLANYLYDNVKEYKVVVILANVFKKFAASLNIKSKTDKVDARILAQLGVERNHTAWIAPNKIVRQVRNLCREKNILQKHKTMITNNLHAIDYRFVESKETQKRLNQIIKLLDKQIGAINIEIKAKAKTDSILMKNIEIAISIKGVGFDTAVLILSETDNFKLFENKAQLVSYAGYDVVQNESGKRKGKTYMSKKGNSHIRAQLFYPAFTHIYCKGVYYNFFQGIYARTKIKMKAYVAVQRKLLVLIFTLVKKQMMYNDDYLATENADKILTKASHNLQTA
jgi:transposase